MFYYIIVQYSILYYIIVYIEIYYIRGLSADVSCSRLGLTGPGLPEAGFPPTETKHVNEHTTHA